MASDALVQLAEQQDWVAPVEDGLQKSIADAFTAGGPVGQKIEDALHGTWLGHPLHPILTDIPIGAWTVAVALDAADSLNGSNKYAAGADGAVIVGLAGAAGAALTGLTDWHKTDGKDRRVGIIHGLLNVGATALFATSWFLRSRKERNAAKICSLAGYLVVGVSGYLGGSLVFSKKIGVDHADREPLPEQFVAVLPEADLPEGTMVSKEVDGIAIMLVRQNGQIYALGNICAHLGGPLSEGTLEAGSVRCPWHDSCFALKDGAVLEGPSTYSQPSFEVRVRDGQIEVRHPKGQPAIAQT